MHPAQRIHASIILHVQGAYGKKMLQRSATSMRCYAVWCASPNLASRLGMTYARPALAVSRPCLNQIFQGCCSQTAQMARSGRAHRQGSAALPQLKYCVHGSLCPQGRQQQEHGLAPRGGAHRRGGAKNSAAPARLCPGSGGQMRACPAGAAGLLGRRARLGGGRACPPARRAQQAGVQPTCVWAGCVFQPSTQH